MSLVTASLTGFAVALETARRVVAAAPAQERVVLAEQAGHRTLAATVRSRGLLPDPGTRTHTEDVRP
ncbi:hypothetical protein ACFVZC_08885 [Streptomyces marokkonensis]|uniref:Uncharacterized protein n=1 Tax=Streptomyces marokkonensis TaxID=324855 RepID=A0ABW6Q331_9ACTN